MKYNPKYIIIIVLGFYFSVSLNIYSQNNKVVSELSNKLYNVSDSLKIEIYLKLIWETRNSNPLKSITYGKKAIKLSEQYKDYKNLSKAYSFTGVAYRNMGNYPLAFKNYQKGLKISEKYSLKEQRCYALINIGNLYLLQNDTKNALLHLNKALETGQNIKHENIKSYCYLNIGKVYFEEKKYKQSLTCQKKALSIRKKQNNIEGQAVCYKNIGDIYEKQANYTFAKKNYKKSLNLLDKNNDKDLYANVLYKLSIIFLKQNNIKKAENYAYMSLALSKKLKNKKMIKNAYSILIKIFESKKEYDKANIFLKIIIDFNDSIYNEKLIKKLISLEYDKKQLENNNKIKVLKKQKRIQGLQIKENKLIKYLQSLIIVFFIILILIGIYITYSIRKKSLQLQKQKKEIESQNKKILNSHEQINSQKEVLSKLLEKQEDINNKLFAESIKVEQKNIEIGEYNNQIKLQKEEIEHIYNYTKKGINYAYTIQKALLPTNEVIESFFKESFLIFNPHSKISGDFYFVNSISNYRVFAVGDCTGHGVAGGFLTILGITFLHEIINYKQITTSSEILEELRRRVKKIFVTFGNKNENGMDITLCVYNTKTNILQFSAAHNPLVIVSKNKLTVYKATRSPIGFYPREKEFTTTEIKLYENDKIYLLTDGYQDQYGGKLDRRIKTKGVYNILKTISHLPLKKQKNILEEYYNNWKGNNIQIDDVTILGINWNKF